MRTAIVLINGLGDQLIAWPTLRALRRTLPGEMELWVGLGMLRSLYRDLEMDRRCIPGAGPGLRELDPSIVPHGHPAADLFVSLSTWCNDSVSALIRRLGARESVGLRGAFTETTDPPGDVNMFDQLFSVARHFAPDLVIEDFAEPPQFSDAAEDAARRFVGDHLVPGERMLFVHPETRERKMWSREGFSAVLVEVLERHPDLRVFLTSRRPYDLSLGRHQHRLVVMDDTPFEMTLAVLRYADAFIGVDSCFMHGADLLRVPGVGLFGPTDPAEWGFRFEPRSRAIWTGGAPLAVLDPSEVIAALDGIVAAESVAS